MTVYPHWHMNFKSLGLREQTSQVLLNRALILKINRAENQKEMWGEKDRKGDSEKSRWWRGRMKCHIVLPKQHYMHGGEKMGAFTLFIASLPWPHTGSDLTDEVQKFKSPEIEELVKTSYGSLWQGSCVKMFTLLCSFSNYFWFNHRSIHWSKGRQQRWGSQVFVPSQDRQIQSQVPSLTKF